MIIDQKENKPLQSNSLNSVPSNTYNDSITYTDELMKSFKTVEVIKSHVFYFHNYKLILT